MLNKFYSWIRQCVVVILVVFSIPTGIFAQQATNDLFVDASTNAISMDTKAGPEVVRERLVTINFDALATVLPTLNTTLNRDAASLDGDLTQMNTISSTSLQLNLFNDIVLPVIFDRTKGNKSGSRTWFGAIENVANSAVTMVVKGDIVMINISVGSSNYQVRSIDKGIHAIRQIDQSAFPPELEPDSVYNQPDPQSDSSISDFQQDASQFGDTSEMDGRESNKIIDVMVVYTNDARSEVGGTAAMEALIDLAISESNTGYANSGINQRLNLVHTEEVTYTESGDMRTDRDRLKATDDGYMDNVHTLRNTHNADLVSLIVHNYGSACGIAFIMETVALSFEDSGFNVVAQNCATGYYSFSHELGHIMGARHNWEADSTDNSPFTYNHAYGSGVEDSRSVMAYASACGSGPCNRVNWWSNPDDGPFTPWGIREGETNAADNRKTLNNTGFVVANFRVRDDVIGASREFTSGDASDNQQHGIMFDLKAKSATTIHGFSNIFQVAATVPRIEIYYRESSYSGHDSDPSTWKLAGSANNVAVQALPAQTHLPIDLDITIPAGETYAFYITENSINTSYFKYKNGTTEGALYASNDQIELYEGRGKSYPFGTSFPSRVFIGTIYHSHDQKISQLQTSDNPDNHHNGIMFDLRAKRDSTIHGFSGYLGNNNSAGFGWLSGMEIYYRVGTHVGFENSTLGWTKVGPVDNVVESNDLSQLDYVQNRIPLELNLAIKAGETYGFYITSLGGNDMIHYTNSTSVGSVFASNADLELLVGTGKAYPFGTSYVQRAFTGTVHYTTDANFLAPIIMYLLD